MQDLLSFAGAREDRMEQRNEFTASRQTPTKKVALNRLKNQASSSNLDISTR